MGPDLERIKWDNMDDIEQECSGVCKKNVNLLLH